MHIYIYIYVYIYIYIYIHIYVLTHKHAHIFRGLASWGYGVATISRLLKLIGLFCKRAL